MIDQELDRLLVDGNISWTAEEIYDRLTKAGYSIQKEDRTIGWFPTHPRNPSKLQQHKFENGEWKPLGFVKYVPWPEAFPKQ